MAIGIKTIATSGAPLNNLACIKPMPNFTNFIIGPIIYPFLGGVLKAG
jgi:hypothetical protein